MKTFRELMTSVLDLVRRRPRLCVLGSALLLVLVIGGIAFAMHKKAERATLAYTVARLNQALSTRDAGALAGLVHFRTLAQGLVQAAKHRMPSPPATPEAEADLADSIQLALLERLRTPVKEVPPKEGSEEAPAEPLAGPRFEDLHPPKIWPENLIEQIIARPFRIQAEDGDLAVLSTEITHEDWGGKLPLRLVAHREAGNWRVTEVANAAALAEGYYAAREAFLDHKVAVFHADNARIRERMAAYCYITGIEAKVGAVNRDGSVLLLIRADGVNIARDPMINAGLICTIRDEKGAELGQISLNVTRNVLAGDAFVQQWNVELNPPPEVFARLTRTSRLTCSWALTAVTLGGGRFLFPKPESDLTKALHELR